MKVGDLVKFLNPVYSGATWGLIVRVDDTHRQTTADILFCRGVRKNVWQNHIEVIGD